jgi:hypothetical protein
VTDKQTDRKPILCVDFDGVIHSYTSPWQGPAIIADDPVPGAMAWLLACAAYFEVHIYSSRSKEAAGRNAMRNYIAHHSGSETLVSELQFSAEKPPAFLTIDDRAVTFMGGFGSLSPERLLLFKPWNKRGDGELVAEREVPFPESWPDPTPEMREGDTRFEQVWQRIKSWDINVPSVYSGYMGATGNHVRAILDALDAKDPPIVAHDMKIAHSTTVRPRVAQLEACRVRDVLKGKVPSWLGSSGQVTFYSDAIVLQQTDGIRRCEPDDWIVRVRDGVLHVFGPEAFAASYEIVE